MKQHFFKKMLSSIFSLWLLLSIVLPFGACSDDGKDIYEDAPKLVVAPKQLTFLSSAIVKELEMESTIKAEDLTFTIPANAKSWITAEKTENNTVRLSVTDAGFITKRATVFTIAGRGMRQVIDIEQFGLAAELSPYTQIMASSATATTENTDITKDEEGNDIVGKDHHIAAHIIDGDRGTYHNSLYGAFKTWPFVYEITFDTPADQIDKLNLVPRQDIGSNGWGAFGKFDVYVSTTEKPEFTKVKEGGYDAEKKTRTVFELPLDKSLVNVKAIKIEVHSALQDRISLAEIEFFKRDFDPALIFTDSSCSKIKEGITQSDIEAISDEFYRVMADAIFNGTYDKTGFRIQSYRPYQDPSIKADENFTESYSTRDNPTGIYAAEAGETIYLFVGPTKGRKLSLFVEEQKIDNEGERFEREYRLIEGENTIKVDQRGLLYIKYLVNESLALTPKTSAEKKEIEDMSVTINIFGGGVNGYFNEQKHSLQDWKNILEYNVGTNILDVQGERIHLSWVKSVFKERLADPKEVLQYWDTILILEQRYLGLEKYSSFGGLATAGKPDRKFRNRMFVHVHPGNPAASSTRIHFPHATGMKYDDLFVDPVILKERIWGPAHEMGHVNQIRPGFNWGGMIETTNNIYCLYIQHKLGNPTRLEQENYYKSAKERLIDAYKADPTRMDLGFSGLMGGGADFEKIVPFWQLHLYMLANGREEYFMDVFEEYRLQGLSINGFHGTHKNDTNKDHGVLQTEFVKIACSIAKMDLTEFFTEWGFLRTTDMIFDQYIERHLVVTPARIKEVTDWVEAQKYPKPSVKLWEINDQNYKSFKDPNFKK